MCKRHMICVTSMLSSAAVNAGPQDRRIVFCRATLALYGSQRLRIILIVVLFWEGTSLLLLGGTHSVSQRGGVVPPAV